MATKKIHIQGINPDGSLKLSDNGHTKASRKDKIHWIVDENSNVAAISMIYDTSAENVFKPNPTRQPGNSKDWQGTINPDLKVPQHEHYNIYYTKPGGTEVYSDDPRIQVDS